MVGISLEDFNKARQFYRSLRARIVESGKVYVVTVNMIGIKGNGSTKPQRYSLLIDLRSFPHELPQVFILYPKDRQIKHKNIFHPRYCSILRKDYPQLCPGTLGSVWKNTKNEYRNFLVLLRSIDEILSNENPHSPAR